MKKSILALLLAGACVLTSLAGCGTQKTEGQAAATEGGTQQEGAAEGAMTYNGQDVSEPVELVMYYIGDKTEDEGLVLDEINKILKEKINATLVLKNMSLSDYSTKYALTIAGGESIDLIYTSTWAFYQSEANKGAFAEVTDQVLNDYMPLHLENQAEASWGQAKIGGKVYFVPCNMANVSADAILIRGDLREKYGMDRLENLSDLEEYYTAVANDPDSGVSFAYDASQNNDRNKAIFLQAKNDWVRLEGALVNYISYKYSEDFTADDLLWMYGTQEYLDFAKQMKEWADKGFWSKSAIANATDVKEAFINGTSASFSQNLGTVGATASEVEQNHPEWKPEVCDLTPDAHRFLAAYTGDGVAVLANSRNQARAFMALDLLKFDKDLYYLVRHGIEGKHYVFADKEKGIITYPEGVNVQNKTYGLNMGYEMPNQTIAYVWEGNDPSIWDEYREFNSAEPLISTGFIFDNSKVLTEISALTNVRDKYIDAIGSGAVDPETAIPEMNEALKKAGLDKVIQEKQAQLDAFIASK